jgi:hypothetical protein
MQVYTGSAWVAAYVSGTGFLASANNLSDVASTSSARTNLGLGTIATQAASSVAITGGAINGTTIGASTPSTGAFSTLSATGVTTVQAGSVSAPAITTSGDTNTGIFFPAADTIAFTEGGVESMRINASGNVGIGTVSPDVRLQVAVSRTSGTNTTALRLSDNVTGAQTAGFGTLIIGSSNNGAANSAINFEAGGDGTNNGSQIGFYTQASAGSLTKKLTVNASGALILQDATVTANGIGITFPTTPSNSSDANTLDDYEEGTWTPNVGGTATYSGANYGLYTKIGNVVTCQFRIAISSIGTGGAGQIRGFPFASANLSNVQTGSVSYYDTLAISTIFVAFYIENNATTSQFVSKATSGTTVDNGPAIMGNGTNILCTITYRVA